MKVFKFGGASVSSVERIENVKNILSFYKDEKLIVIISAIGKTTNALEKVAEAFYEGKKKMHYNFLIIHTFFSEFTIHFSQEKVRVAAAVSTAAFLIRIILWMLGPVKIMLKTKFKTVTYSGIALLSGELPADKKGGAL